MHDCSHNAAPLKLCKEEKTNEKDKEASYMPNVQTCSFFQMLNGFSFGTLR